MPRGKLLAGDARADRRGGSHDAGAAARSGCAHHRRTAVDKALAWALERLDRGPVLIASSAAPERLRPCSRVTDGTRPAMRSSRRSRRSPPASSGTACAGSSSRGARRRARWWTGSAFRRSVGPEIAAGVPVLRTVGMRTRDGAGAQVRQFRRTAIFFRRARLDAVRSAANRRAGTRVPAPRHD